MGNLALDSLNHDVYFEDGQIVLVSNGEAIAQDIKVRLLFFKGEWALDTRLGVPYYEEVLGQKPNLGVVKNLFRKVILQTPGVKSINNLDVTFDSSIRTLIVSFFAETIEGEIEFREELII
jgi:hypothetical protein